MFVVVCMFISLWCVAALFPVAENRVPVRGILLDGSDCEIVTLQNGFRVLPLAFEIQDGVGVPSIGGIGPFPRIVTGIQKATAGVMCACQEQ